MTSPALLQIRAVALLLRASVHEEPNECSLTLELSPTTHLWVSTTWAKRGRIFWQAKFPGKSRHGDAPNITTSATRSAEQIASDLSRRLLPSAKEYCRINARLEGLQKGAEQQMETLVERLSTFLGPERCRRDRELRWNGFSIPEHQLRNGGGYGGYYTANIRVHSIHCLMMIARLIGADERFVDAQSTEINLGQHEELKRLCALPAEALCRGD